MKKYLLILMAISLISIQTAKANDSVYGFAPAPTYGFAPAPVNNNNQTNTNQNSSVYGFAPAPANSFYAPNQVNSQPQNINANFNSGYSSTRTYGYTGGTSNYSGQPQYVANPAATQKIPVTVKKVAREVRASISTEDYTNSVVNYFYYIPAMLEKSMNPYPVIIWVPGLDGNGEKSIPSKFYELANTKGYAILSPTFVFNEEDFKKQKSYQYPNVWSGNALLSMLDEAKKNGLNYSKLYMAGFSAGGQFVSRFSFIHPEIVDACAILSSGARVKPQTRTNVKYFIGIGNNDDEYRLQNAEIFHNAAANLGIPIVYKKYNMDHTMIDTEEEDVVKFFDDVRENRL